MTYKIIPAALITNLLLAGCSGMTPEADDKTVAWKDTPPASAFDLGEWTLQVPIDLDGDERADNIPVVDMQRYIHPDFFYLDDQKRMVFTSPNKGMTSPTSTNTRSELRHLPVANREPTSSPKNNFALAAHPEAATFAAIGGKLEAVLHVDHVARNAGSPNKFAAYSVVVGQIHALKMKSKDGGFGYGNEPLKIFYKKWPGHDYGSVFWNYERNLPTDDENRIDIAYPVWGYTWDNPAAPGESGIAPGETFGYTVDVRGNIMNLTFTSERLGEVRHSINLADNIDANGTVDEHDHPQGYAGDPLYFKAGAYNQCSTKISSNHRYPGCPGTGDWATDQANGDYARVTFSKLKVGLSSVRQ